MDHFIATVFGSEMLLVSDSLLIAYKAMQGLEEALTFKITPYNFKEEFEKKN